MRFAPVFAIFLMLPGPAAGQSQFSQAALDVVSGGGKVAQLAGCVATIAGQKNSPVATDASRARDDSNIASLKVRLAEAGSNEGLTPALVEEVLALKMQGLETHSLTLDPPGTTSGRAGIEACTALAQE